MKLTKTPPPSAITYARLRLQRTLTWVPGSPLNPHAAAAAERQLCGIAALEHISDSPDLGPTAHVFEMGADAVRTASWASAAAPGMLFWSNQPRIYPGDNRRILSAQTAKITRRCECFLEDCQHLLPAGHRYRVVLAVHAIYYVSLDTLVDTLQRANARAFVSVEHMFPDAAGKLCDGTVTYYRGRDALIHATADGDTATYSHDPADWRREAVTTTSNGVHLARAVVYSAGDTLVAVYRIVSTPPVPRPSFDGAFRGAISGPGLGEDPQLVTTLNRDLNVPGLTVAVVPVSRAVYLGGMFVLYRNDGHTIPLPIGLIASLATLAAGKPRDPALYQILLARAKRVCSSISMPDDLVVDAVVYAAVAALARCGLETAALGHVVGQQRHAWRVHTRVLGFTPLTELTLPEASWGNFFGGLSAVMTIATIPAHAPVCAAFAATSGVAYLGHRYWQGANQHDSDAATAWLAARRTDGLAATTGQPVLHFHGVQAFPGQLRVKTNPPQDSQARVVVGQPERPIPENLQHGLRLVGIGLQSRTPSYIEATEEAAIAGLRTRLTVQAVPAEDLPTWDVAMDMVLRDPITGPLFLPVVDWDEALATERWARYVNRFPGPVAAGLQTAQDSLRERALEPDDYRLQAIVKREKTGHVDELGVSANNPRIVLSLSPRLNAAVGADIYHAGLAIRAAATPEASPYAWYAVSATAEELGDWFDEMTDKFSTKGPAWYGIGDQRTFDARQRAGALKCKLRLYKAAGVKDTVLENISIASHPTGYVQKQRWIRFRSKTARQVSGGAWTTLGNCAANLTAIVYAFGSPGPDSYAVAVCGDDYLIIGFEAFVRHLEADIDVRFGHLGLSVTYHATTATHEVEFVSLLPYPTADGTVFAPKIGRHLCRGGWTVSSEHADIYGSAVSMADSVAHVPFLKEYYEVHRRLARPSETFRPHARLAARQHDSIPETWEFVERRYGLTRAHHAAFLLLLDRVTALPAALDFEQGAWAAAVDE